MMSVVEKELNKRPNINSMCVPLERREKQKKKKEKEKGILPHLQRSHYKITFLDM